jgi:hypothetical protein
MISWFFVCPVNSLPPHSVGGSPTLFSRAPGSTGAICWRPQVSGGGRLTRLCPPLRKTSPQDTQTRSRPLTGKNGPSDSALAATRGGRLRRPAAERHAARCASRALCSGGAPRRYSPSAAFGMGVRVPFGSFLYITVTTVAVVALLRAAIFIHELAHLKRGARRAIVRGHTAPDDGACLW